MAESSQLTQYIESFVDVSRSPAQQAASLNAIVNLLKNNELTIETMVKEMGMYLTTTDDIIRARGILLLGELLTHMASKALDDATISSLIKFFTDRLADWKALRGALVGCLALVSRKSIGSAVTAGDAKAVASAFTANVQVQSLAQHDRKLSLELLDTLLQRYPDAVTSLGDHLFYTVCEAIDGEKDPRCLMLTFHIVEVLARISADDLLSSFAQDLFEILGCYFPIHFTHPKSEDLDVKRDDLSRMLMLAFSSTPLFEPFAIPLFLEKLSSSLPLAKLDSLKYLNQCTLTYGAERIANHAGAIWSSLKDAIYTSHQPDLNFALESLDNLGFEESGILAEALTLLQTVIKQTTDLFINHIVGDEDIQQLFDTISDYNTYSEINLERKLNLHAVGCILYISAKASVASCNRIIENFLPRLVTALGISVNNSFQDQSTSDKHFRSGRLNHGALYLCTELLAACQALISCSEECLEESASANEMWYYLLQSLSASLNKVFTSILATSTDEKEYDVDMYFGVKGLMILATYPGSSLLVSKSIFETILLTLTSVITEEFNKIFLWKLALKALVRIGSVINKHQESDKSQSFMGIVIEKIVSLVASHESSMPFSLKLDAISDIGASGPNYMLRIIQGLEDAICANLSDIYVLGNPKSVEIVVQLLECYSNKVLPWIHETGGFENVLLSFAINIWDLIEKCAAFSAHVNEKGCLDATMKAMKLIVGSCSVESQDIIIRKGYKLISLTPSFPSKEPMSAVPIQLKELQLTQQPGISASRDEFIHSLFASVIIAVHSQTQIPNVRLILHLFVANLLKGSVPAAQALGSLVNKLGKKSNSVEMSSNFSSEEALDVIFNSNLQGLGEMNNGSEIVALASICRGVVNNRLLQMYAISGLAWIGKGLLMKGHDRVKDITMILLDCLLSNDKAEPTPQEQDLLVNSSERDVPSVAKCASNAFQILMSDSEDCLSRKFHAIIRPLYKQRFYSTMMPILRSLIVKSQSSVSRSMLCRAFAHIISETPLSAILNDAKMVIPLLLDALFMLSNDILDKDIVYHLLLVLFGILTDKNGQEAVLECAHLIMNRLIQLITYPHMMLVRETAVQCLIAMSRLPHSRVYPMRTQVLKAVKDALDDPKRAVRLEAVRCRQAWASTASRSLHF